MQLTDFENTCLLILTGMMVNAINRFNLDFILPISKVDQNLDRANQRNAILDHKFWFNKNFI